MDDLQSTSLLNGTIGGGAVWTVDSLSCETIDRLDQCLSVDVFEA